MTYTYQQSLERRGRWRAVKATLVPSGDHAGLQRLYGVPVNLVTLKVVDGDGAGVGVVEGVVWSVGIGAAVESVSVVAVRFATGVAIALELLASDLVGVGLSVPDCERSSPVVAVRFATGVAIALELLASDAVGVGLSVPDCERSSPA